MIILFVLKWIPSSSLFTTVECPNSMIRIPTSISRVRTKLVRSRLPRDCSEEENLSPATRLVLVRNITQYYILRLSRTIRSHEIVDRTHAFIHDGCGGRRPRSLSRHELARGRIIVPAASLSENRTAAVVRVTAGKSFQSLPVTATIRDRHVPENDDGAVHLLRRKIRQRRSTTRRTGTVTNARVTLRYSVAAVRSGTYPSERPPPSAVGF
ncbi:hypothetical protein AGLY_012580 [Aphis glycines]|uniref:Secreted protein n=1 Tax=Aphis glycines TaxID=307491 RepID=A0A6G0TAY2_APHGL|nr:hypothetical protein AGLY_012580 [Aphis glycines]